MKTENDEGQEIAFVKAQIADMEVRIKFRDDSKQCWASGTDASWRAVGCRASKSERLKTAALHGRIADKNRKDLAILKSILATLSARDAKGGVK